MLERYISSIMIQIHDNMLLIFYLHFIFFAFKSTLWSVESFKIVIKTAGKVLNLFSNILQYNRESAIRLNDRQLCKRLSIYNGNIVDDIS